MLAAFITLNALAIVVNGLFLFNKKVHYIAKIFNLVAVIACLSTIGVLLIS